MLRVDRVVGVLHVDRGVGVLASCYQYDVWLLRVQLMYAGQHGSRKLCVKGWGGTALVSLKGVQAFRNQGRELRGVGVGGNVCLYRGVGVSPCGCAAELSACRYERFGVVMFFGCGGLVGSQYYFTRSW